MIPQELRDAYKRERAARAVAELVHEVGTHQLTVTLITEKARMARATFYELFGNRDQALNFAAELGNRRLKEAVQNSLDGNVGWQDRVRAALEALIEAVEAEPYLSELCLAHSWVGRELTSGPYDPELVEELAGVLRPNRNEAPNPGPSPRTGELLAYAALSVIAQRLRNEEVESLRKLGGELSEVVMPFLVPSKLAATEGRYG